MAEDKDVLGKADALLRRHQVGVDTGGVPVLTERFQPPPAVHAVQGAEALDLSAEERALVERVTQAVEARLAADLERRVTREIGPRMDEAIASAVQELRGELAGTIAQAVREALKAGPVK